MGDLFVLLCGFGMYMKRLLSRLAQEELIEIFP